MPSDDTIEYECPCCGAKLVFDVASQKVKCPYCCSEFDMSSFEGKDECLDTVQEASDVEVATDGGEEWDPEDSLSEYVCDSCGGEVYTDDNTSATMCPYCGNPVILKGRLSGVLKPDKVIPFKVDKKAALDALDRHCKGHRFVPKDFIQSNKLEEVRGLYVPFWVYDAEVFARIRYTGVDEKTWSSGDIEYTERKYYDVRRSGDIAFDNIPVDGSSSMPDDLMESLEPFDQGEAVDFKTAYLSGHLADKYDVAQEDAAGRARTRIKQGAEQMFSRTASYDSIEVVGSEIVTKGSKVDYMLYPVWLFNTSWDGKPFQFALNGQSGKIVGNLPLDKKKLVGLSVGIFLAIALFAMVGEYLADPESFTGFAVFGFVLGGIIAAVVYGTFKKKLISVDFQYGATEYYRKGSMKLTEKSDRFMYKQTSRRKT